MWENKNVFEYIKVNKEVHDKINFRREEKDENLLLGIHTTIQRTWGIAPEQYQGKVSFLSISIPNIGEEEKKIFFYPLLFKFMFID